MASRDLSRHQSSIVKRYYKNLDTIVANRLQEAVTELYLAESDKKRASLWKKVRTQLEKTPADPELVQQIVEAGDVERLAKKAKTGKADAPPRTPPKKDADTVALEKDLSAALGMKVAINHQAGGEAGSVQISYKSLEDLDDLCRKLGG